MSTGAEESVRLRTPLFRRRASERTVDPRTLEVEALFSRFQGRIGRYLAQIVDDRALAEDLLQDTFHDAFRFRDQLPAVRNAEAWLFGIARNRALAALRRRRRFQDALGRLARRRVAPEPDSELVALRDLLERHLSPEDRSLLVLRYVHGFDAAELGEMTGRSAEAVRQRLARTRAKLLAATDIDRRDPEV